MSLLQQRFGGSNLMCCERQSALQKSCGCRQWSGAFPDPAQQISGLFCAAILLLKRRQEQQRFRVVGVESEDLLIMPTGRRIFSRVCSLCGPVQQRCHFRLLLRCLELKFSRVSELTLSVPQPDSAGQQRQTDDHEQ